MFEITFAFATVSQCDFIGRTVHGVQAVVTRDGVEVFRSSASVKRARPRAEAMAFIAQKEVA